MKLYLPYDGVRRLCILWSYMTSNWDTDKYNKKLSYRRGTARRAI